MDFNLWTAIQKFMESFKLMRTTSSRDRWHRSNRTRAKGKMVKRITGDKKRIRRKMAKASRRRNRRAA